MKKNERGVLIMGERCGCGFFGDDCCWIIIVIIVLLCCCGGNGFGCGKGCC